MYEKYFLDTNILIYLYSDDEINKRKQSENFLEISEQIIISTQVVNEFVHVFHHKRKMSYDVINKAIHELHDIFTIVPISFETIAYALTISKKHHISYFDGLIVASALENKCSTLFTEDLHDSHIIDGTLKISNPYKKTNLESSE